MKKPCKSAGDYLKHASPSNFLLTMKLTVTLLLFGLVQVMASSSSYSQDTRLSLDLADVTIEEVLDQIENQSEFYFLFNQKLVETSRKVDARYEDESIQIILEEMFDGTTVGVTVMDRQILLSPDMNSIPETKAVKQQQGIEINGNVSDANGDVLPGVNVWVKGENKGTISDLEGNFTLTVENRDAVIEFSYVGYLSQEIVVAEQTFLSIKLIEDIHNIDEVVVVGYGTQKKVNLTGAIDVISGDELSNRPAENMGQLLQGTSPNLNIGVSREGGEPGAGQSWSIRGLGTLSGSSAPLILVDGIEMDINMLNPQSVESVSVLKDAAASAIYGARAPFGVILITTKKGGKNQKIQLSYDNNFGFASPIRLPEFESSLNLATAFNQAADNAGTARKFGPGQMDRIRGHIDGSYLPAYDTASPYSDLWGGRHEGNANIEWMSEYWKKFSFRQKHDISLQGGDEKTQYYVAAGTYEQDGMFNYGYDSYSRKNLMANITSQVTPWARFDFSTKYGQTETDYPLGMLNDISRHHYHRGFRNFWPTQPMYNEEMDPNDPLALINPQARSMDGAGRDVSNSQDSWITLGTELEPMKGWKTNVSYNYNYLTQRSTTNPHPVAFYAPSGDVQNIGQSTSGYTTTTNQNNYSLFNAKTSYETYLSGHFFRMMVGYEQESAFYSSLYGSRRELISTAVPSLSTALGESVLDDALSHWATQAVFSRISYNFKEKYLVEFNGRYNGSSRFAPDQRWGFFPSVGVGYNLNKEEFWAPIKQYVNTLKIRASYGSLGNQNVPNYLYLANVPISPNLDYVMGNARPLYAQAPSIVSSTLTWETVTTLNLGLDASFLNNRLSTTVEVYSRNTSDMFGPAENLPALLGTSPAFENNAEMQTDGWELSLSWRDMISSDLSYNFRFFLGDSKSKVVEYKNEKGLIDGWYNGKQLGEIWGYVSDGLIQVEGEEMPDQSKFHRDWGPGDMKYKDLNGDGIIDDGEVTLDSHGDLQVIGNSLPRFNYGISAGANWKGFDINMFWQGVGKRDYFPTYVDWSGSSFWGITGGLNLSTVFKGEHLDYWRPEDETNILGPNTDSYFAKPYSSLEMSKNRVVQTKYLLNAAYVRLKNLQVGYTIPKNVTQKIHIEKLRIYFSGENLLTLTKMTKLLDPETAVVSGTDIGGYEGIGNIYPLARVLSFGLNVTF